MLNTFCELYFTDPPLVLSISPIAQVIAAAAPYNTYSLLCTAAVPIQVHSAGVNFVWTTLSPGILLPNSTVSIENSLTSDSRNFYFVSNLTIEHTNTLSEVVMRLCLATVTVNGIETESSSSALARVTIRGKSFEYNTSVYCIKIVC